MRARRVAFAAAVLVGIIGLDWWVEGFLRQSAIRDRLADLSARCEVSFTSARDTLGQAEQRLESSEPSGLRVFAPIPPMEVLPSGLEDPALDEIENRLILLDQDARGYEELLQVASRLVATQETRVSSAWERAHQALAAHVKALRLACDRVENELIARP